MSSPPDQPAGIELQYESGRFDPIAVARVSTQAEPESIRLVFLHADIDERGGPIPSDWSAQAVMGFNSRAQLDRKAKTLIVTCGFLAMFAPGVDLAEINNLPTPKEAPFELHASFTLGYKLRDVSGIEDRDPEEFAATNGVMHAWPYWREIAQSTTVRFGLAPLLVGTYKLPWSGDPQQKPVEGSGD
jgi:hypothetical protein